MERQDGTPANFIILRVRFGLIFDRFLSIGQDVPFIVPVEKQRCFLRYLAQNEPLEAHLLAYPNVGEAVPAEN